MSKLEQDAKIIADMKKAKQPLDDRTKVKQWLYRGWKAKSQMEKLSDAKIRAEARACNMIPRHSLAPVNTASQKGNDKFDDIIEFSKRLDKSVLDFKIIQKEISSVISLIEDAAIFEVFICRYIHFLPWNEIALELNHSTDHVRGYLHMKGINAIKSTVLQKMKS